MYTVTLKETQFKSILYLSVAITILVQCIYKYSYIVYFVVKTKQLNKTLNYICTFDLGLISIESQTLIMIKTLQLMEFVKVLKI